ncbi:MAG: hypothetical protein P9L99_06260 [Candidatus Lernaella stagnicola]|nr:hypothetical protein [Candidatus Lernaella stagnicola]
MKTARVVALAILCTFLGASVAFGAYFGSPETDSETGKVQRTDTGATYTWLHRKPSGERITVTVSTNEGRSFFQQAQRIYKAKSHRGVGYQVYIYYDPYKKNIDSWARILKQAASRYGVDDFALALSFVQSIPYQDVRKYQRYAFETLIDWTGDCSDTSVLLASIIHSMGYGAVLVGYPTHLAVGIKCSPEYVSRMTPGKTVTYFDHKGGKYYLCETTGMWFQIGEKPPNHPDVAEITSVPRSAPPYAAQSGTATFNIRSRYAYKVFVEFCSANQSPYSYHWPEHDKLWVIADNEWHEYRLDCTMGDLICFGARNSSDASRVTSSWGSGAGCKKLCQKCCIPCGGSYRTNLTP